jgi:hypothetical protein
MGLRAEATTHVKSVEELNERSKHVDTEIHKTLDDSARTVREQAQRTENLMVESLLRKFEVQGVEGLKARAIEMVKDFGRVDLTPAHVDDAGDDPKASEELAKDAQAVKEKNPDASKRTTNERELSAQWTVSAAALVTAAIGGASLIMSIWVYLAAKKEADGRTSDLPPGVSTAEITRLVEAWRAKSDAEFWSETANYIEQNQSSISMTDEINILKVVQSMSVQTGWIWSATAFNAAVNDFMDDMRKSRNTPDAYRMVMRRTYAHDDAEDDTPEVMPRRIAAEVLAQALARYLRTPYE